MIYETQLINPSADILTLAAVPQGAAAALSSPAATWRQRDALAIVPRGEQPYTLATQVIHGNPEKIISVVTKPH